jgi:regulator of protease activity HflC (stomatin/prohibitin superfamily)
MRQASAIPATVFFVIAAVGTGAAYRLLLSDRIGSAVWVEAIFLIVAILAGASIKIASQWERAVVLRLGKFKALRGPGMFFIIPIVDVIPYWIDIRVITSSFKAEKTLTKDTVPVDVDAVLFWRVMEPERAALDVEDYHNAIAWASQTALRDVIARPRSPTCSKAARRSARSWAGSSTSAASPGASASSPLS